MADSERRKNRIVRIPSFEIERKEEKKTVLLHAKHRLLDRSGVYEKRRAEDLSLQRDQEINAMVSRGQIVGLFGGYLIAMLPSSYLAAEAAKMGAQHSEALQFFAGISSLAVTEISVCTVGYHAGGKFGRWVGLRLSR